MEFILQHPRLWSKIDASGDCWEWTASRTTNGYGQIYHEGKLQMAHRVTWSVLVGPVGDGLVIDHLCRNKACVNPDHLEPVTQAENIRRGTLNANRRQGKCGRGHQMTEENTYSRPDGRTECRECRGLKR